MQLMILEGYYPVIMGLGLLKKIKKVAKKAATAAGKTAIAVAKTAAPVAKKAATAAGKAAIAVAKTAAPVVLPAIPGGGVVNTATNVVKNIQEKTKQVKKIQDNLQKNIITTQATAQNIKKTLENIKNIADKDTINILKTTLKKQEEKQKKLNKAKKILEKTIYIKFVNDLNVNIKLNNTKKNNTIDIMNIRKKLDEVIK